MNSIYRSGLNKARASADAEAAAGAADVFDTISSMLEGVRDFAKLALKDELGGGLFQDEAAAVVDSISDAVGAARQASDKVSG